MGTKELYKVIGSRSELRISLSRSYRLFLSGLNGIWMDLEGSKLLQQVDDINAIQECDGSIWVGARKGLSRWRNGKWTTWGVKQGLPGEGNIYGIAADANGRFWMMADGGILAMNRLQLDQTPDGEPRALTYLRIGSLDRISPHTGGMIASPRVTKDAAGRLFFATFDSFGVVDPSRINQQSFSPPIVLETVLVNRRPVAPRRILQVRRTRGCSV